MRPAEPQTPQDQKQRNQVSLRHLIAKGGLRSPDTADDEYEHGREVSPECDAARYVVWPAHDGNGEADYQRQPEVDAEGSAGSVLELSLTTFGVPFLA